MISKIRVSVVNKKPVYISPSTRTKGYTDARVLDLPKEAIMDVKLLVEVGKSVPNFLADLKKQYPGKYWVVFQASYYNDKNGALLGKAIKDGKVIANDVAGKTEKRPHIYWKDKIFGIGRVESNVDGALNIVPTLTKNGAKVYPIKEEVTPSDVAVANPRILFGIKNGNLGIVLVDGRGSTDAGLSAENSMHLMADLGYENSGSGDGGGSSTLATNLPELLKALQIDEKRQYHVADMTQNHVARKVCHAIAIQINPDILFPKKKVTFGIDCASPLTAKKAKDLANEGVKFAVRYVVSDKYAWKRLTKTEVKAIQDAGLMLASVFQEGTSGPSGGADRGKIDGKTALAEMQTVGQPKGSTIFFAADYDVPASDYDKVEAYLKAAQKELPDYYVGIYGHKKLMDEMKKRKACKYFWQTLAWSNKLVAEGIDLYQYKNDTILVGHSVDYNECYNDDIFWGKSTPKEEEPKVSGMFKDVPDNHFAKASIEKAAKAGIIVGVANDLFAPDQPLTRAQLAVILDRVGLLGGK